VESPDATRPDGEPSFHCYTGQQLQARVTCKKLGVYKKKRPLPRPSRQQARMRASDV
jgi:hypothetical protein